MNKVFIGILTFCAFAANAQEENTSIDTLSEKKVCVKSCKKSEPLTFTSKNGYEVLPQAGDWGIGISATAPLNYLGAVISTGGNATGAFGAANSNLPNSGTVVFGKYFLSSTTAYRAMLSTNTARATDLSGKIADDGDANNLVQDKRTVINRGLTVGFGIEKRRGYNRLIGVYGAQAILGFNQGTATKFQYANEISAANQTPTDGFGSNNNQINVAGITDNRTLETGINSTFNIGAQLFVGLEYFVAPRISLGGEFNWTLRYAPETKSYTTVEYFNSSTNAVEEFTQTTKGGSDLNSRTGSLGGNVNLMFYF